MDDDYEPGPEPRAEPLRLNAREQKLALLLIGLAILVCVLMLASWFL